MFTNRRTIFKQVASRPLIASQIIHWNQTFQFRQFIFFFEKGEKKNHLTLNSMTLLSISCLSHLIVSKKFQEWPNWHVLFYSSLIITVFRHSILSFASDNNRANTYNCIPIRYLLGSDINFFSSMESLFLKQKVFRHNRFIGSLYFVSFNLNKADASAIFLIGREIIN